MTFLRLLIASGLVGVLTACVEPHVTQETDCRGAQPPCGFVVVVLPSDIHAMTTAPVTVPVSALPAP